ncbi:MAG: SDR family oxidoreductase [Terriglobales bacterium]
MKHPTSYRTIQVDGLSVFYREAGPRDGPKILLLHGLPSSSRMFDPLFARLSDRYHLVAPDYPGFERFFRDLPAPIDHVMVTAGRPYYGRLLDMDFAQARRALHAHLLLVLQVARNAAPKVRPGGTLLFMGGTGARRPGIGLGIASTVTAALPALTANLALELAPVRVNLIAPGFVDTPLSASLLGDELENRRNQLRATLPIGRVVGPADVAALAVHIMTNTALTGATYDVDGGQQFVAA